MSFAILATRIAAALPLFADQLLRGVAFTGLAGLSAQGLDRAMSNEAPVLIIALISAGFGVNTALAFAFMISAPARFLAQFVDPAQGRPPAAHLLLALVIGGLLLAASVVTFSVTLADGFDLWPARRP